MTNLRPLGENVIVKPLEAETLTKSGIILPDSVSQEKPMRGEIMAIGNGSDEKKLDAKVGDIIVFTKYAPTEIKIDGQEFYILGFDSVLAVVEN